MKHLIRGLLIAVPLALATTFLVPVRAYADAITFTGATSITLTETGTTSIFFYTLTNNSGAVLSGLGDSGTSLITSSSGSDAFVAEEFGEFGNATCALTLASGSSCTMEFSILTTAGTGDGGVDTIGNTLGVSWNGNPGPPLTLLVPVTINDFPVSEPSSLLLLASSVVSMGIFRRGLRATSSRR